LRRTVLVSLLIIGAALGVVFGGGSFALFSDEENIEGGANGTSATAGILDFEICGDPTCAGNAVPAPGTDNTGANEAANDEILTITFDTSPCTWDVFAPGNFCEIPITLYRALPYASQLAADLVFDNFSGAVTTGGVLQTAVTGTDPNPNTGGSLALKCDGTLDADGPGVLDADDGWQIDIGGFVDNLLTNAPDEGDYFPAGENDSARFTIKVTLDTDADNTCQGDSLTVKLTVRATQDNSPHNTDDQDLDD
jgi:predicted ribosomally synthesized peptide with SipW-like signal peptide